MNLFTALVEELNKLHEHTYLPFGVLQDPDVPRKEKEVQLPTEENINSLLKGTK